jgi:hypothetical protein
MNSCHVFCICWPSAPCAGGRDYEVTIGTDRVALCIPITGHALLEWPNAIQWDWLFLLRTRNGIITISPQFHHYLNHN